MKITSYPIKKKGIMIINEKILNAIKDYLPQLWVVFVVYQKSLQPKAYF